MQDPVDLEAAYQCATAYESATLYGQSNRVIPTSSSYIDDPMDTSINMIQQLQRQNTALLNALQRQQFIPNNKYTTNNTYANRPRCFVCDKTGHFARDCYQRSNNINNNGRTNGYNNNYRNTGFNNYRNQDKNINNRTSYNFRNNNNSKNTNSTQSFNAIFDQYNPLNYYKNLIDLTPTGSSDPSRYFSYTPSVYSEVGTPKLSIRS